MKNQQTSQQVQNHQQSQHDAVEKLPILEQLDLLVSLTRNFPGLLEEAESSLIISELERHTILKQFGTVKEGLAAFYLLLSSKQCSVTVLVNLLNKTGNEIVTSVFKQEEEKGNSSSPSSGSGSEASSDIVKEEWLNLKKVIVENIDRLSSHTRNLGLVLCMASGIGLITAKDREIIANYSQLEIDQLKQFYWAVSGKDEDAYDKLLKVLKMTNNNWALDVLKILD